MIKRVERANPGIKAILRGFVCAQSRNTFEAVGSGVQTGSIVDRKAVSRTARRVRNTRSQIRSALGQDRPMSALGRHGGAMADCAETPALSIKARRTQEVFKR